MVNNSAAPKTLHKAFLYYSLAYLTALATAFTVGYFFRSSHSILTILFADIAATLVIYLFGRMFHNASFYDAYWSVAPPVIGIYWFIISPHNSIVLARQIVVLTLVLVWGIRLTANWARQWQGINHEDWRYQNLRKSRPGLFWLVDLVGIELMPTVLVFLGCLALYPSLIVGNRNFGWLDITAAIITAGAIVIETIADRQMRNFTRKRRYSGEIMDKGLWAYSRHPNYFGEVTFWWGLFFFALASNTEYWWTAAGPLFITILFVFVSIPMMEKRSLERRPGYAGLQKRLPALFPTFPKK